MYLFNLLTPISSFGRFTGQTAINVSAEGEESFFSKISSP